VGKPVPVKVDTRFLAGTNRNLAELVRRGEFRRDLYYRLNIVRIAIPPLRNRGEDVPVLLDHFSRFFATRYERPLVAVSPEVRKALMDYPWPGNVRELAAWAERLYATGLPPEVLADMLLAENAFGPPPDEGPSPDDLSLDRAERHAIVRAMDQCDSNQRQAAQLLKVHRATLARKLKKYDLT
jgi:DNA-binding NtrC family response regulator